MSEKITKEAIIDAVAAKSDLTQKEITKFSEKLYDVILENLIKDKRVEISGLGVFSLSWKKEHRGIDFKTKEKIMIAGHYKLYFNAEKELNKLINKDLEHLQPVELSEETAASVPLDSLSRQADEIKGILSDIQGDKPEENKALEDAAKAEQRAKSAGEFFKQKVESPPEVKANLFDYIPNDVIIKKKSKTGIWTLIVLLLLAMAAFAFFYLNPKFVHTGTDVGKAVKDTVQILDNSLNVKEDINILSDTAFFANRKYTDFYETVKIEKGVTLVQLAEKYYGNKIFWLYIYEANRDKILNPNKVKAGLNVKIPKLDSRFINQNDTLLLKCVENAEEFYIKK